jgi:hypothetical protein
MFLKSFEKLCYKKQDLTRKDIKHGKAITEVPQTNLNLGETYEGCQPAPVDQ